METVIVIIVVTIAGFLLVRYFYRRIRKRETGCNYGEDTCPIKSQCHIIESGSCEHTGLNSKDQLMNKKDQP